MIVKPEFISAPAAAGCNIGMCQLPTPMKNVFDGMSKCQNALSTSQRPLSQAARIVRADALAELRAARTALRRLKAKCLEHYDHSDLHTLLDEPFQNSPYDSLGMPSSLVRAFRTQTGYEKWLEAQSNRAKERSCILRRKLIQDGFADSHVIDDQMAYDLGL